MKKSLIAKFVIAVLTALISLISALYLGGCETFSCNGAWCYGQHRGTIDIVRMK